MSGSSFSLKARVEREKKAHEEDDVLAENIRIKSRFAHILSFPSRTRMLSEMERISLGQASEGRRLLDYGCGRGQDSLRYLNHGADVHGIDISATYIDAANKAATQSGFSAEQFSFQVIDAHKTNFPDNYFDLVVGYGILHHLDPDIALREIHRILKPGGRVMLQEPLADNPLLKIFRLLTPKARTEDEKPFTKNDIGRLCALDEWKTELLYCGLVELPVAMITSILIPNRPDNVLIRLADRVERWTHKKGILLSWNQYVVFNMVKISSRNVI